jgi:osmotically-inducible protein OsmY
MRTDAEIFTEARHALDATPTVPATVRLHVDHGVVTLTGSVRLTSEQHAAEELVVRIPGVRRVVNDIFVAELPSVQGFERPAGE